MFNYITGNNEMFFKFMKHLTMIGVLIISLISLLPLVLQMILTRTHWIWSFIYYFLHSQCIQNGFLTIIDETIDQKIHHFGDPLSQSKSTITITDDRYFRHIILDFDIGLGESFVLNYWNSTDLTTYLSIIFSNYNNQQTRNYLYYLQLLSPNNWYQLYRFYSISMHSTEDDERYIQHHYDWGIALFQLFLDETMTYTAANFDRIDDDLKSAQISKVKRIVNKANIKRNDNILEIGSGFGYLSSYIINNTNATSVTGITLSKDQIKYSQNEYESNRLEYVYRDYRYYLNNTQRFNAIISVEMIEAIGYLQLNPYFETISSSLIDGGRFVIQFSAFSNWIWSDNDLKAKTQQFPTFVTKHIFPGGFQPNEEDIYSTALKYNLELIHSEKFGLHYAKTLHIWLGNLRRNKAKIIEIFDYVTYRTFEYYLAWAQICYQTQTLHIIQAIFEKTPQNQVIGHGLNHMMSASAICCVNSTFS